MSANDSDDAKTADRDNSRDRKPAKTSHSKIADRKITEHEKSEEAQEAYRKVLADKAAAKKRRK